MVNLNANVVNVNKKSYNTMRAAASARNEAIVRRVLELGADNFNWAMAEAAEGH